MLLIHVDQVELRNFKTERAVRLCQYQEAIARGDMHVAEQIRRDILAEPNRIPRPPSNRFIVS